jgi:hypothetical protein
MLVLDGLQWPIGRAEADRLRLLAPRLTGRKSLDELALHGDDAALVLRLLDQGAVRDLRVSDGQVQTGQFTDYLYARVSAWRSNKPAALWPWREVIAAGKARISYLQGLLVENYHYVRAASVRQSPLLSHAGSARQFDLIRGFVTEEANHEGYFLESLTRWGMDPAEVRASVPLASTAAFIGLQYRLAHRGLLDYLAGSVVLEVDPRVYARRGDPYQSWCEVYGIGWEVLAPVREHIRDDVEGGHASLFRAVAEDAYPHALPLALAVGAMESARTVFGATRLWQRDMYEHYQAGGGSPAKAAL